MAASLETAFTRLVGCSVPIQQAPLPGHATVALAAAVADAGGVGMLGTPLVPAGVLARQLAALGEATRGVFGCGFLVPFLDADAVDVAARGAALVEFFYGDPDPEWVKRAGAGGARVGWQVGSLAEALAATRAGCDYVVLQGTEAGGHVRGREALASLLAGARELDVPALAAGGIATGAQLAAALRAGAAGARVGTRFLAAEEASVHPVYREALLRAGPGDTVLTTAFGVLWPDAPHRVLRSALRAAEALEGEVAGEEALPDGSRTAIPRFAVVSPTRDATGRIDAMALYAGESVAGVTRVEPAAAILEELTAGALAAGGAEAGAGGAEAGAG